MNATISAAAKQVRGHENLGCIKKDAYNYLNNIRRHELKVSAWTLLDCSFRIAIFLNFATLIPYFRVVTHRDDLHNVVYDSITPEEFGVAWESFIERFHEQVLGLIGSTLLIGEAQNGIAEFFVEQDIRYGKYNQFAKTVKFLARYNEDSKETWCKCKMFETAGIPCSHMMSVWKSKKLSVVPEMEERCGEESYKDEGEL
ncbi:hypothetical protein Dimus_024962 [Dionaea muscipula]